MSRPLDFLHLDNENHVQNLIKICPHHREHLQNRRFIGSLGKCYFFGGLGAITYQAIMTLGGL